MSEVVDSEEEANLAREQHAAFLRSLGAHGIAVDRVTRKGRTTFIVTALFEEKPKRLPKSLKIKVGSKEVEVPLVGRRAARFRAE